MLGPPAGCHRSAASTELQLSDLRDGLLRVAAATSQPASFLLSHGRACRSLLTYERHIRFANQFSLDRLCLFGVRAVFQQPAEATC